jgi:hypothetical protein
MEPLNENTNFGTQKHHTTTCGHYECIGIAMASQRERKDQSMGRDGGGYDVDMPVDIAMIFDAFYNDEFWLPQPPAEAASQANAVVDETSQFNSPDGTPCQRSECINEFFEQQGWCTTMFTLSSC